MLAPWDSETFADITALSPRLTTVSVWHRGRKVGSVVAVYVDLRLVGVAVHDPTGHVERCGMLKKLEGEVGK